MGSERENILLDIGCGTGLSTSDLQILRAGLDPAENLLKYANDSRLYIKSERGIIENDTTEIGGPTEHLGYILGVAEAGVVDHGSPI